MLPCGTSSGSWFPPVGGGPAVLTVNGLEVFVVADPKVAVHVVPGFGIVAAKAAQLAVADTPAVTVTALLAFPVPPLQYMVKPQTPEATVCVTGLVKLQDVATPGAIVHADPKGLDPGS